METDFMCFCLVAGLFALVGLVVIVFLCLRLRSVSQRVESLSKNVDESGTKVERCLTGIDGLKESLSYVRAECVNRAVDERIKINNSATGGSINTRENCGGCNDPE